MKSTMNVPSSIDGKVGWGKAQKDKNVVYRKMHLIPESNDQSSEYVVMITRFPFGDFGYMVSIDGDIRYAKQFRYVEDIQSIGSYLKHEKYPQDAIDLIVFTLQDLIADYFKKDKETGNLKMS